MSNTIKPLIKVCGMRQPDNIRAVAQLPVDYIGFIFYPKSSRYVDMKRVRTGLMPDLADADMSHATDASQMRHIDRVGVFVDATVQDIIRYCLLSKLDAA